MILFTVSHEIKEIFSIEIFVADFVDVYDFMIAKITLKLAHLQISILK